MVRARKPPSQKWRTFLENHVKQLVSTDFLVVSTVSFRLLFVFIVVGHFWMIRSVLRDGWSTEAAEEEAKKIGMLESPPPE